MNVLVAEDDQTTRRLLEAMLRAAGYTVHAVADGVPALDAMRRTHFDAVITDWMMPAMEGIELVRHIRTSIRPAPAVIMVTAIDSDEAKAQALDAGADEYVTKPVTRQDLLRQLRECLQRRAEPLPSGLDLEAPMARTAKVPPFPCVVLVGSSGGPIAMLELLRRLRKPLPAALLLSVHGPNWMMQSFEQRLRSETRAGVRLLAADCELSPGVGYLLASDRAWSVEVDPPRITCQKDARPSNDVLLQSVARGFGPRSIVVVLTGLGREGTLGVAHVAQVGGSVLVQDPKTAAVPALPQGVLDLKIPARVFNLDEMGRVLASQVEMQAAALAP